MADRTPDWMLERIALGELPPDALAAAKARLAQEPDGLERLARLEADSRATLERHPPERVLAEVERRRRLKAAQASATAEARPARRLLPSLALGVPVLASLVLLVLVTQREPPPEDTRSELPMLEATRPKGDPQLVLHRQGAAGAERLEGSAQARRGDVLQLGYNAAGKRYGAVLSLDGRGTVTLHLPQTPDGSLVLKGGAVSLPNAYELDDAPAFERFVLVTSEEPFDLDAVLTAARALARDPAEAARAPLALPASLSQTSVTVQKVP